jgi:hypothetical protein
MQAGETKDLREVITADAAFTITAKSVTVYDSTGTSVASGTPSGTGAGTASQTLSYPFTPATAGVFYAVFSVTVADETRRFEQRVSVETAPRARYPQESDLRLRIRSLGVLDPDTQEAALDGMALAAKASAASAEWEKRSGWNPFLAAAADTTRYYDPPGPNGQSAGGGSGWTRGGGRRLVLDAGLVSLTSILTGYTTTDAGTALTVNEDFWLMPEQAASEGAPYEWIEFVARQFGPPRSVVVTGKCGFCLELPADVFEAVLQWGLWLCYPELALAVSKGLYSARTLNSELRYAGGGMGALSNESAAWQKALPAAALRYMRIQM